MEEDAIVLLRNGRRGARRITAKRRPRTAHQAPHLGGGGEGDACCLATLLVVALQHIAAQSRMLTKQRHRLGAMQQAHIAHAVRRQISQHTLMQGQLLHDLFNDLTLRR